MLNAAVSIRYALCTRATSQARAPRPYAHCAVFTCSCRIQAPFTLRDEHVGFPSLASPSRLPLELIKCEQLEKLATPLVIDEKLTEDIIFEVRDLLCYLAVLLLSATRRSCCCLLPSDVAAACLLLVHGVSRLPFQINCLSYYLHNFTSGCTCVYRVTKF